VQLLLVEQVIVELIEPEGAFHRGLLSREKRRGADLGIRQRT
jgi:hypothetical protein